MIVRVKDNEYEVGSSKEALNVLRCSNMFSESKSLDEWLESVRERIWMAYGVFLVITDYDLTLEQMRELKLIEIKYQKD